MSVRPVEATDQLSCYEAQLPAELGSIVAARRLVEAAAATWGIDEAAAEDAALAVSELVTNAVLHAGSEVGVSLRRLGRGMRIEVRDGSDRIPVVGVDRPEDLLATRSMTGRGLALLAATADRWGADPLTSGGKIMWAEVGTGRRHLAVAVGTTGPAQLVSLHPEAAAAGVRAVTTVAAEGRQVHLLGVPVRLLVESSRQLADLQREIQVLGLDRNVPTGMADLALASREISACIETLSETARDVGEEALARGDAVVDFDLTVPGDVLAVFERLGTLMRQVGGSLVECHLLTLPPSREVVAYRLWYRDEVASQLRGRPPRPCPFAEAKISPATATPMAGRDHRGVPTSA
jgi:anti-sigma regulatory factor (Ser/Thr protein kinase)